jgi:hypothetical protein
VTLTDEYILNWLDADPGRLEDVYGYIQNEGGTVREAVEFFTKGDED